MATKWAWCVALAVLADDDMEFAVEKETGDRGQVARRWWTRPWILERHLDASNTMFKLSKDLILHDDLAEFRSMLRMNPATYYELLALVGPELQRQNTVMRQAVTPDQRLTVTLHYLAHGESQSSLSRQYKLGRSTVGEVIKDTCRAIHRVLEDEYMATPVDSDAWEDIATGFERRWQFPHCVGAVDGKHVRLKTPPNCGSLFYNYKGFNSLVLMALVNHRYEFVYVDVGSEGRMADGGVWRDCTLRKAVSTNTAHLPDPSPLPRTNIVAPYCIVGDDAFPLGVNLMKPFSQRGLHDEERIFNYRLSRARRVSENAFGIMANRWRVFLGAINLEPEAATNVILAGVILHNFLRRRTPDTYIPPGALDEEVDDHTFVPGAWRADPPLQNWTTTGARNWTALAKLARLTYAAYFVSPEGEVPWQYRVLEF